MWRTRLGMLLSPACAGPLLAVLLVMAILWHDVLWREGDDLRASWAHPYWGDGRVRIPRVTGRARTRETVVTMEGLGGKGGRAIQGHPEMPPEGPETVEQVVRSKTRQDLNKDRVERARGERLEEGAEVMVAGALRDAKQRAGVIAALVCSEPALIRQKRGRWSKEDPTGASGSI